MSLVSHIINQAIVGSKSATAALTNLLESVTKTAPNATVPAVQLIAKDPADNVDLALSPKGTGALAAHVADATTAGGDKRGTNAVDWQTKRTSAGQVASGVNAVVAGGTSNQATNLSTTVSGGQGNSATGSLSVVSGGSTNSATATHSVVCGGDNNWAGGNQAAVLGGRYNTASGEASVASGAYATARAIVGAVAHSSGTLASSGGAQAGRYVLMRASADATPLELTATGGGGSSTTRLVLTNNCTTSFVASVAARSSSGESASWEIKGVVKRGSSAGTTALVGTLAQTLIAADAGASGWSVSINADTTNGAIRILVTGAAATNVRWVADVQTVEVIY